MDDCLLLFCISYAAPQKFNKKMKLNITLLFIESAGSDMQHLYVYYPIRMKDRVCMAMHLDPAMDPLCSELQYA